MKKQLVLFTIIILLSMHASAAIYRSVDSNGIITYSDQPTVSAEAVALPKASVSTKPPAAVSSVQAKTENTNKEKKEPYATFEMQTPKDQETIQNVADITLSVDIQPALQKGDTVQFFLDDHAVNDASANTSTVVSKTDNDKPILTRGTHTIYAELYNEKNEKIKTTPEITVFIHYASALFPKQP